jgi:hypothetical protein
MVLAGLKMLPGRGHSRSAKPPANPVKQLRLKATSFSLVCGRGHDFSGYGQLLPNSNDAGSLDRRGNAAGEGVEPCGAPRSVLFTGRIII